MLEPILQHPVAWAFFGVYLVGTTVLAVIGHQKTDDLASFAIGKGDMGPIVVGVTLAASIASTATFVINPGFVYVHGLSALLHLGAAAGAGIVTGLLVLSRGFRDEGTESEALTLPHWLGNRYNSEAMTVFFAVVSLLNFMFVVLIVGGLSIVMQQTLGISNVAAVALIIGFVFSYIFLGGTYAHAFTNTLQGIIMTGIAVVLVGSGLHFFGGGLEPVWSSLAAEDPNLVRWINPDSELFGSWFSIYVAGYVIGFGLVAQPHVLIKTLYVDTDREMWQAVGVCIAVSAVFLGLLLVGVYAHLAEIPSEAFIDPTTGKFRQDMVMTVYVTETFSPWLVALISVTLLAAGMSTLDGILIALSSIVANDLFLNLTENNLLADRTDEEKSRIAHRFGQGLLIALGLATFVIALDPPELLGIFGQVGVYGIVSAGTVPILAGIVFDELDRRWIFASAVSGLVVHLGLYCTGLAATWSGVSLVAYVEQLGPLTWVADTEMPLLGFKNPAVTATYGMLTSALVAAPTCLWGVTAGAEA
jgi:SSS family solute:Na+ symporter/sodium/pantothenate symporter